MARKTAPQTRAQKPSERNARSKSAANSKKNQGAGDSAGFFSENMKRDIAGVCFGVLAVALFVAVTSGSTGMVTVFVNQWLHLLFGIGCYILPFVLVIVGVTFLYRFERERMPLRVTVGLTIVFVGLLAIFALSTPGASAGNTVNLLSADQVAVHGGYIGGALAFGGVSLLGHTISLIVAVGIIAVGLVIIGFSINSMVEKIREKHAARREAAEGEDRPGLLGSLKGMRGGRRAADDDGGRSVANTVLMGLPGRNSAQVPVVNPVGRSASYDDSGMYDDCDEYGDYDEYDEYGQDLAYGDEWVDDFDNYDSQDLEGAGSRSKGRKGSEAGNTVLLNRDRSKGRSKAVETDSVALEGTEQQMTRRLGRKAKEEQKAAAAAAAAAVAKAEEANRLAKPLDGEQEAEAFMLPSLSLLKTSGPSKGSVDEAFVQEMEYNLVDALASFGIDIEVKGHVVGPTVTLFKIALPSGVRLSKITALTSDIALALASQGVRIFAPVPGTNYVGIEVPNRDRQMVLLGDVIPSAMKGSMLNMCVGKDVEGNNIVADLASMPHLLIAGTTGSGKSVTVNSMIMTILMRATPDQVRFILIDPKRVEFSLYNGIPHLYVPVVTEPKEASSALAWGVAEMERRLKDFSKVGARNIAQFNRKVDNGEIEYGKLPYIVIVIDELADLMMNVGKEVEFSISRLAQLARAAGIHLIVATQRPSANVVTGLIKANITNRISLNVASSIDSRVILDSPGAENLLNHGDLLFGRPEYPKPQRMQSCFVSEDEITAVVEVLKSQGTPDYHSEILKTNLITLGDSAPDGSGGSVEDDDPLLWEAADIVVSSNLGSTSNIQRRLKVGYARAGRIMDQLEEKGVVGPPNGSKPRDVLVDAMELETLKAFEQNDYDGSVSSEG